MADKKISALTGAATPLAGTEVLPIVQSGATVKVSIANVTAGRAVSMLSGTITDSIATPVPLTINNNNPSVAAGTRVNFQFNGSTVGYVGNQFDGGDFNNLYNASRGHIFTRGATQTMLIDNANDITVSAGNLKIGTAAKGIDFSANGGDILSQYDEGSWTVKLFDSAGGGNQSATTVTGYYTRVGNLVQCSFWGLNNISTAGMTAGNGLFIELPFTASATGSGTGSFASENITFNGRANATPAVPVSNNRAILRAYGTGTSTATVLVSNVGAGANIDYFSMTYRV